MLTRRRLLATIPWFGAASLWTGCTTSTGAAAMSDRRQMRPLRFGVCTDVHQDIMHDAESRLRVFIERMRQLRVDFVIQLGDFCVPDPRNRRFLETFCRFGGPRHHVIGNHDMDENHTVDEVVAFWGMPSRYYSFDQGGFHFVVLDANDPPPGQPRHGYPCSVAADQLEWLERDLAATERPTVVFTHQGICETFFGNSDKVRAILRSAVRGDGGRKVFASFCGHTHSDRDLLRDGVHFVTMNSMSYRWLGQHYAHDVYDHAITAAHPAMRFTAPYEDSVYATVTLDPAGLIVIDGVQSDWVGPSPWDLGCNVESPATVRPGISDRRIDCPAIDLAAS
jgi:3',5'-cyclic-AMP phosphodiesterase